MKAEAIWVLNQAVFFPIQRDICRGAEAAAWVAPPRPRTLSLPKPPSFRETFPVRAPALPANQARAFPEAFTPPGIQPNKTPRMERTNPKKAPNCWPAARKRLAVFSFSALKLAEMLRDARSTGLGRRNGSKGAWVSGAVISGGRGVSRVNRTTVSTW